MARITPLIALSLLILQATSVTLNEVSSTYSFSYTPALYYSSPSGYNAIRDTASIDGAWFGFQGSLNNLTKLTFTSFCNHQDGFFWVSEGWNYYCLNGLDDQYSINQINPLTGTIINSWPYQGQGLPEAQSSGNAIVFDNAYLADLPSYVLFNVFSMDQNVYTCDINATLAFGTSHIQTYAIIEGAVVLETYDNSLLNYSMYYIPCNTSNPVITQLASNTSGYTYAFALNDSSVFAFADNFMTIDIYTFESNGVANFESHQVINAFKPINAIDYVFKVNDTHLAIPIMVGGQYCYGLYYVNSQYQLAQADQGCFDTNVYPMENFIPVYGTTQVIAEMGVEYHLVYDYDLGSIVQVVGESTAFAPITLANGTNVYYVQDGFWVETNGVISWLTLNNSQQFFNPGDYDNSYYFTIDISTSTCQAAHIQQSTSTFQVLNLQACLCNEKDATLAGAYWDASNNLNIGYFCGAKQFFFVSTASSNGPFLLTLGESAYTNLQVNTQAGTVTTMTPLIKGLDLGVFTYNLTTRGNIQEYQLNQIHQFTPFPLNGEFGLVVEQTSNGSSCSILDFTGKNTLNSFTTSLTLDSFVVSFGVSNVNDGIVEAIVVTDGDNLVMLSPISGQTQIATGVYTSIQPLNDSSFLVAGQLTGISGIVTKLTTYQFVGLSEDESIVEGLYW